MIKLNFKIIAVGIILSVLGLYFGLKKYKAFVNNNLKEEIVINNKEMDEDKQEEGNEEKIEIEKVEELEFTQEQLQKYYEVYENPYVLHLRQALNNYLDGGNEGIDAPEIVIEAGTFDDGSLAGLDSFSKDYYKSKFIVMAINDGLMGGKIINIIFQDKPDKLFNAWVYQLGGGGYDFRGFWENTNFTKEKMEIIHKQYKKYLEDKQHAL